MFKSSGLVLLLAQARLLLELVQVITSRVEAVGNVLHPPILDHLSVRAPAMFE